MNKKEKDNKQKLTENKRKIEKKKQSRTLLVTFQTQTLQFVRSLDLNFKLAQCLNITTKNAAPRFSQFKMQLISLEKNVLFFQTLTLKLQPAL